MKVGDLVMWTGEGRYARWFFGRLATVTRYTSAADAQNDHAHCRVKWVDPVKYHDRYTSVSDFRADNFEVI